ncbi:MAG: dihydrofolate reductase [Candidatus Levybacteria bacterium]|nr:dihydrofolate reductase [Candidatus Levybacteria bacterium]
MISIICAMDNRRGIGKGNDLLFRIPEDFKRMKALTSNHPLVMGRKTFESIGRPLPNRTNIVITRDPSYQKEGIITAHSLNEGIEKAKQSPGNEEIFIFGGGQIFKEALDTELVNRLYLTIVKGDYNADTFFPNYTAFTKEVEKKESKDDNYRYTFLTLDK